MDSITRTAAGPRRFPHRTVRVACAGMSCDSRATLRAWSSSNAARIRSDLAADHSEQRGLARAVPADQGKTLTGLNAEIGLIEEREIPVGVRDLLEGEKRHANQPRARPLIPITLTLLAGLRLGPPNMWLRLASGSISLPRFAWREDLTHLVGIQVVKFSRHEPIHRTAVRVR